MHYALFITGALTGSLGLLFWLLARTSIHQIQAAVMLLIACVLLSGGAVVAAIERLRTDLRKKP